MCKKCVRVQKMRPCAKQIVVMCQRRFVAMYKKCGHVQRKLWPCAKEFVVICKRICLWPCTKHLVVCKKCGHVQANFWSSAEEFVCGHVQNKLWSCEKMWSCPKKIVVMHTCKHDCGNKLNHEIGLGREARRPKPYGTQPSTNANASWDMKFGWDGEPAANQPDQIKIHRAVNLNARPAAPNPIHHGLPFSERWRPHPTPQPCEPARPN